MKKAEAATALSMLAQARGIAIKGFHATQALVENVYLEDTGAVTKAATVHSACMLITVGNGSRSTWAWGLHESRCHGESRHVYGLGCVR